MYLLLAGCGVGFSVQEHHVARLPPISNQRVPSDLVFRVPDSVEGWSDAIGVLLSSYFLADQPFPEYAGKQVKFDLSEIRPKGTPISHITGLAPGPEPLNFALEKIKAELDCLGTSKVQLRPIQVYDILMYIADAVLAGGVRRSATIALFSSDDDEMMNSKTGQWFVHHPARARSNISAVMLRKDVDDELLTRAFSKLKSWGEPGIFMTDSLELLTNPCAEVGFYCYHEGKSGFQVCNLSEINGSTVESKEDFYERCTIASIVGTLQAGYTTFPYLGEVSEAIIRKEALIGVGITGMMETPDILFDPVVQRTGAELVRKVNRQLAAKLKIRPSARCTVIKPSGSTSIVLGCSSGIHPTYASRYFRRVQIQKSDHVGAMIASVNPKMVQESLWSGLKTDNCVTFCIEQRPGSLTKTDIPDVKLLEKIRITQENWIRYGRDPELCAQPYIHNNVSNTVTVAENRWDAVKDYILQHKQSFAGIAFLPESGDLNYSQSPFQYVPTAKELVDMYGEGVLFLSYLIEQNVFSTIDEACDYLKSKAPGSPQKEKWVAAVKRVSDDHFSGDILKVANAIKQLHSIREWNEIKKSFKKMNWDDTEAYSEFHARDLIMSCSAGSCELNRV